MILAELLDLAGLAEPNTELIFDDHGRFRALTRIYLQAGKMIFVLEPHATDG